MDAIKGFLNSEKAIAVGALVIAATVLTALGHMTVPEWKEYTMVLAGIYVSGKTIQGAVSAMAGAKVEAAKASAATTAATTTEVTTTPGSTPPIVISAASGEILR